MSPSSSPNKRHCCGYIGQWMWCCAGKLLACIGSGRRRRPRGSPAWCGSGVEGDAGVLEVGRYPVLCTELETIKPGIAAGVEADFFVIIIVCVGDWAIFIVDVVMW